MGTRDKSWGPRRSQNAQKRRVLCARGVGGQPPTAQGELIAATAPGGACPGRGEVALGRDLAGTSSWAARLCQAVTVKWLGTSPWRGPSLSPGGSRPRPEPRGRRAHPQTLKRCPLSPGQAGAATLGPWETQAVQEVQVAVFPTSSW